MCEDTVRMLFGGSKSEPQDVTAPDIAALRKTAGQVASSYLSDPNKNAYQGPLTGAQPQAVTDLLGQLMADAGGASGRQGLLQQTIAGGFLPGQQGQQGQPSGNPFLDAAVQAAQRSTVEATRQAVERSLPALFTAGGQVVNPGAQNVNQMGSSAFTRALGDTATKAQAQLGDIASNMYYGGYNFERQLQQQAIGLSQQEVQTTIANIGQQMIPYLIEQQGIQNGIDVWKQNVSNIVALLQATAGLAGMQNVQTQQSSQSGIIPGIAQLANVAKGTAIGGQVGLGT